MDEEETRNSGKPPEPTEPTTPPTEPQPSPSKGVEEAAPTDNNVEASAVEEPAPVEETLTPEEPAPVEEPLPTEEPAQEAQEPKYVAETPAPPTQPRTIRIELESTGRGEEGKVAKRYIEEGQTWQFGQKKSKETKTVKNIEKHNGDFTITFDDESTMRGNPLELSEIFNRAKKVKKENGTPAEQEEAKPAPEEIKLLETELIDGAERYPIKVGDTWRFTEGGGTSTFILDKIEPREGRVTLSFHDASNPENKNEHSFTQEEWIKILKRFEKAEG
jgi:hypothetical protein